MTLRQQILSSPETLSDLAWAAEERFREGEELLVAGRLSGAVYLFGLAAEMWLKIACFRFRGGGPATVVAAQLGPARLWMRHHVSSVDPEGYHSLLFWIEYLIRIRREAGNAFPQRLLGQLRHHVVNRLYQDWKIDVRYRSLLVTEPQAWRVYNDVMWIRQNWMMFWR